MNIPLCKPSIGEEEIAKVTEVLKSGWLTHGPYNEELERLFAKYIGVPYAQTVNSCASALFIALKALNITGEIILPSFTFVASANAVVLAGATPVFADVDFETGNITADQIKSLINTKTEAVMVVHFAGQSCVMDEIVNLCLQHKLTLIEDSAEAIGSEYKGKKTGSFGIGCFSFFPTKNMTTGEGGMITTNDVLLMQKIKTLIAHGIDKSTKTEYAWQREAVVPGFNMRMSGILAGLGIEQLKKLDQMNDLRRAHAAYLSKNLDGNLITVPKEAENCKHTYQMYTIKIEEKIRNDFIEELKKTGIGASVHFSPAVHQMEYYKKYSKSPLLNTEKLTRSIVTLPMYPDITKNELDYIIQKSNEAVKKLTTQNPKKII